MKALAIGLQDEEFEISRNLVLSNISKSNLIFYDVGLDLTEILTSDGPFSYIIINLDEKRLSAPEIHDKIEDIIGHRPYIFLGTQNAIKSQLTNELINNHKTNHILEVPALSSEMKKAIHSCEMWIKNEEFEQSIQEFPKEEMRSLRIKNFFLFEQLPYDVYIELTQNKYGKIITRNKFFSHQLLHNYSKKNIKFLHIKKNEHLKILDSSIKNLLQLYKSKHIDRNNTIKIHQRTIFFIQEYIKCLSVTEEINELSHLFADSLSEYVIIQKNYLAILKNFENLKQITFADASLLTAYLCLLIITEMQWTGDTTKEKLVLASILQDINLNNDELIKIRSLNELSLKNMTEEEQEQFRLHPLKAQEVARLFHGYTEIDFILRDHHEHPTGDGFPMGINTSMLTTISCIFILATHFVAKMAKAETSTPNIKEILGSMRKVYGFGNFKEPMKALIKIFL